MNDNPTTYYVSIKHIHVNRIYMYIHNAKLGLTNPAASINHNWPRKCLHIKKEKDPLDWSTPLINQPPLLKSHFLDAPISWFSKSLLIPVVSHHVSSKLIVTDLWKSPHFPNDWFQIRFFKKLKHTILRSSQRGPQKTFSADSDLLWGALLIRTWPYIQSL